MQNNYKSFLIFAAAAIVSFFTFQQLINIKTEEVKFERVRSSSSPKAGIEMKKGRDEFFFNMLRDPATNRIPEGIRTKELKFPKKLTEMNTSLNKVSTSGLTWAEAGPNNVGGRTRALAVDVTNPNVIIAGGISGGIWKSTNNGATWVLKSSTSQILSITSIAQDPRSGSTQNWYYTTGEFDGNSARDRGGSATFTGDGIYKSTDNGESWNVLQSTKNIADGFPPDELLATVFKYEPFRKYALYLVFYYLLKQRSNHKRIEGRKYLKKVMRGKFPSAKKDLKPEIEFIQKEVAVTNHAVRNAVAQKINNNDSGALLQPTKKAGNAARTELSNKTDKSSKPDKQFSKIVLKRKSETAPADEYPAEELKKLLQNRLPKDSKPTKRQLLDNLTNLPEIEKSREDRQPAIKVHNPSLSAMEMEILAGKK